MAEFDKMVEKDDRIVVAYQGGLYDMTNFTGHPGGVGRLQGCALTFVFINNNVFKKSSHNPTRIADGSGQRPGGVLAGLHAAQQVSHMSHNES